MQRQDGKHCFTGPDIAEPNPIFYKYRKKGGICNQYFSTFSHFCIISPALPNDTNGKAHQHHVKFKIKQMYNQLFMNGIPCFIFFNN